ncbi:MAG: paraquat-inducible protein A [Gammaproteobacteria bacterium]
MRAIVYPILLILALGVIKYSAESAELSDAAARRLNLSSSTELAWKSFLEKLSFNLYQGAHDEKLDLSVYYAEAERKQNRANNTAVAFFVFAGAFILIKAILINRGARKILDRDLALDCIVIAFLSLVVGILSPIMALSAFTELPVLGTVILKYESKSVVSALSSLFSGGNWFIGLLVALFSVLVPALKTGISLMCLQSQKTKWSARAGSIVKAIGKWSMADVFVIAIFIAYFALGSDQFSDATVGLGLYFFSAYCLISQFTSHYLLKSATRDTP